MIISLTSFHCNQSFHCEQLFNFNHFTIIWFHLNLTPSKKFYTVKSHTVYITEKIACILCMHLGACRFFMHPIALMHLKKNLKQMHPAAFYFSCTYTNWISLRIIIKDYIISHTLINQIVLIGFAIAYPKPQFKAVSFSDIFLLL